MLVALLGVPAAVLPSLPQIYARLIGWVRIIAANARTAAVCLSRGRFARISRVPLMRVMDGCALLAAVFAPLDAQGSLATES